MHTINQLLINLNLELMTENQQRIISNIIAEFNKQNEAKEKRTFRLIDVNEFDAIHQRHLDLKEEEIFNNEVWEGNRLEYIYELMDKIREDLGDRLIVNRGDDATDNPNLTDQIYIYKHGTNEFALWEKALRFRIEFIEETHKDEITKEYYTHPIGLRITRYIDGNYRKEYKDEVEFFNCTHTKNELKRLLK